jgi:tRNA-2-methylthio-N6-dimethylallyladenosine synthase
MNTKKNGFVVETFGCQMNVNDSEKVAGLLQAAGNVPVDDVRDASFVFINTCAVREKAADKLFHALGRLRKLRVENPDLKIGVGGCVAQLSGTAILDRVPDVDVLVGTHNLVRVPEFLERARETGERGVDLDRKADTFSIPSETIAHGSPVRAYVTVMEGCNHVCSFCVVPRTRGPEVCRPADMIVAEVADLVSRGYPEVMLLGQTVNAYDREGLDFAALLERVHAVPGLERLRFTTSHPEHVSERMADAFRDLPRLCPYLHLPVQSGSDRVLASMRRGYDRATYLEKAALLRDRRAGLVLTSDIIVGYPGETDDDFAATVSLVDAVGFEGLFVFTYSPRPGTTALRLADDVPEEEKLRRLQILNERQQRAQARLNAGWVGRVERVLVDAADAEKGRISGRTPHFRIVHADGPAHLVGRTVDVEILGSGANSLTGRILGQG